VSDLPLGYSLRLAIVRKVYRTKVECEYTDRQGERTFSCPIPHPYAGKSGGLFIGIERDVRVLIGMASQEMPYIVGIIPDHELYFSQDGVLDTPIFLTEYPKMRAGEVEIRGPTGSKVGCFQDGSVVLDAGIGDDEADIELSPFSNSMFVRTNNICKFTEAGREIEGVIRRDKNEEEDPVDTSTFNFLSGKTYDTILEDIGRSPEDEVQLRTAIVVKSVIRNPALVERRNITYEYANSFGVRGLTYEATAMLKPDINDLDGSLVNLHGNISARENRRTDILNLNSRNYNHLIEKVEGTVVDIYGNVLDINRHVIKIPEVEDINTQNATDAEHTLRRVYNYLRRSVKYHFEINSRKELSGIDPSTKSRGINKDHSRWSIDVDGEGLTKINIPSSSETGNIPILSRYVVSKNEEQSKRDEGQFKDSELKDIRILQFGAKSGNNFTGQTIDNAEYVPDTMKGEPPVTIGTAYHDLTNIAPSIFQNGGKLRNSTPSEGATTINPMVDKINNRIPGLQGRTFQPTANADANAGGRSIHANLDGSMEMSVGADTADRKSIVLDLAGGVIAHYGRDRNGRSLIHQTDGDVIIQIGGPGVSDDRFTESADTEDRPGRVEIHLNRPGSSATNQKIIIDEDGITIDIIGNGIFKTTGDLSISAGGKLLLNGERVLVHGSVNDDIDGNRAILGGERDIGRKGRNM